MYDTHAPTEWAAMFCLSAGISAAVSIPFWLLVDADPGDFDPRPAVRRAIESGRFDPLLITVASTRLAARDAARLFPATGGTR